MTDENKIKKIPLSVNEHGEIISLSDWMEFFGFFYYIMCGMFIMSAIIVLIIGFLASGAHTVTLFVFSLILVVYGIIAVYLGINLFKSGENFRSTTQTDKDAKKNLIKGFERLIKFFWLFGALIVLNLIWLAFIK